VLSLDFAACDSRRMPSVTSWIALALSHRWTWMAARMK